MQEMKVMKGLSTFDQFEISGYEFDKETMIARFLYRFDEEEFFVEEIDFSHCRDFSLDSEADDLRDLDELLFSLSIALGVSYYKLFPVENIYVSSGLLSDEQQLFWRDFYKQGLGEFFFRNDIDPIDVSFSFSGKKDIGPDRGDRVNTSSKKRYLLCLGGGKDSLVSAAILKKAGCDFDVWSFGKKYPIHEDTAALLDGGHLIVPRKIAPLLLQMNKQGYYNGHVPITGIIHFVSQIVAYLCGYSCVVFSNERSANFGNTVWKGLDVNHQWSKSFAFESAFEYYRLANFRSSVLCCSLLRPRNEIRIAQEFTSLDTFLSVFSSCNRNFHLDGRDASRWCNVCPKCVFVYAMLRPYLPAEAVMRIWGKELYLDAALLPLFQELWGVSGHKPFECVGSYDEMQYATYLSFLSLRELAHSPILQWFGEHLSDLRVADEWTSLGEELLSFDDEHLVPSDLISFLS